MTSSVMQFRKNALYALVGSVRSVFSYHGVYFILCQRKARAEQHESSS